MGRYLDAKIGLFNDWFNWFNELADTYRNRLTAQSVSNGNVSEIATPHDAWNSQARFETIKASLETLTTDRRREIAERIRTAREFGDIAENAEYDDAKNEQAMLEHKIAQLEERLARARVIDTDDVDTSVVSVGSVVRLRDVDAKETVEYFIVGSAEANPAERRLSNESPVGRAILGRKKGETVEVITPRGSKVKFKIMEIKAA